MGSFLAFLIYSALHIPLIIAEKNMSDLNPPQIQVIGGTDIEHPILRFSNQNHQAVSEIQYLLPKADVPFLTRETKTDIEVVPGVAPCRVRVRAKIGGLVSKWGKPVEILLVENDPIFGFTARNGY